MAKLQTNLTMTTKALSSNSNDSGDGNSECIFSDGKACATEWQANDREWANTYKY